MIQAGSSERGACADCGAPWRREGDAWQKPCDCATTERLPCVVLDPFMGSGTTGQVAQDLGRDWIGCELNPDYLKLQAKRTAQLGMFF